MNFNEALICLQDIKTNEDLMKIVNQIPIEFVLKFENKGYIKEVFTQVEKEEFKENRKIKDGSHNYRYKSKKFNFSVEKSGTRYYRRDYILT